MVPGQKPQGPEDAPEAGNHPFLPAVPTSAPAWLEHAALGSIASAPALSALESPAASCGTTEDGKARRAHALSRSPCRKQLLCDRHRLNSEAFELVWSYMTTDQSPLIHFHVPCFNCA